MSKNEPARTCPKCGGFRLIRDLEAGEEVCGECGLVISNIVNHGAEWRAYEPSEMDKGRGRQPIDPSQWNNGVSTSFNTNKDGYGKLLSVDVAEKMNRLRKVDTRSKVNDSQSRNLVIAMAVLERISSEVHLPEAVRKSSAALYRKVLNGDMVRGRSIDSMMAACVYAACRQFGLPRSLEAIADAGNRDYREVARTYRFLLRETGLKVPNGHPERYIPGIASKLGLSVSVERLALEILRDADSSKVLYGKDPQGLAGSVVYLALQRLGELRTQKAVAVAAGTTEVTLRNRSRSLRQFVQGEISEYYVELLDEPDIAVVD